MEMRWRITVFKFCDQVIAQTDFYQPGKTSPTNYEASGAEILYFVEREWSITGDSKVVENEVRENAITEGKKRGIPSIITLY